MAAFTVTGCEELLNCINKASKMPSGTLAGILEAMASTAMTFVRQEGESRGIHQTVQHLTAKAPKLGGAEKSIFITFDGHRHRSPHDDGRNATIAFVNEFGVPSKHMAARPFLKTALEKHSKEIVAAGQKVFDDWLSGCGF